MIPAQTILTVATLLSGALGCAVLLTNPYRPQNKAFFAFSISIGLWALSIIFIIQSTDARTAEIFIRLASAVAVIIPLTYHLLCISVQAPSLSFGFTLRKAWLTVTLTVMVIGLCFTRFFLQSVEMPGDAASISPYPEANYGGGFILYGLYFPVMLISIILYYARKALHTSGLARSELQYILLGMMLSLPVGGIINLILPILTGSSQSQPLGPLSVIVMNMVIAYGIATKRILDVADILRRATSYFLMLIYMITAYTVVWYVTDYLGGGFQDAPFPLSHLLAALAVAFSLAPAQGIMQNFANRLFLRFPAVDVERTIHEANRILQSVSRLHRLLEQFATLIGRSLGTDQVRILLADQEAFTQNYPPPNQASPIRMNTASALAGELRDTPEPLVTDLMLRRRPTPRLMDAAHELQELGAAAAVAIRHQDRLEGVILLGPRLSGRIYGGTEQDVLKLLGDQLAVAMQNAKLYTEIQDSRIYNNILLDNLVSGVIAANRDGRITTVNREAMHLLHRTADDVIDKPTHILPPPIAEALHTTLKTHESLRDQEAHFVVDGTANKITVRIGTAAFWGHQGDFLGALVMFSDTTRIKALEEQIRRHDRLASIGTLSAGMAHEIKNPLVSIKTFTDLLPERYEDEDFRATFSSLVGQEVRRIDSIVNQLLRFARPASAVLEPISLHEVVTHTLRLVDQQILGLNMRIERALNASDDHIMGDVHLLQQALINFFLNAMESMHAEGTLTVRTTIVSGDHPPSTPWLDEHDSDMVLLTISDTGCGIAQQDLPHVFDPFFSTKHHGTGLGLSVAHGIIEEHRGTVRVESEPGNGTSFHLYFVLIKEAKAS